ncbi:MAG: C1 family peptidase [Eubacteriales bacterium]|nr:C1 family peptidase [Eubacteriales bacterium]
MTIDSSVLRSFSERFHKDPVAQASKSAIARVGLAQATFNNDVLRRHNFKFSDETARGEITYQKQSGRCWMFASLNTARVEVMKKLNLETFEFSQNYSFFWDKLEKAHSFLEYIIETREEELTSRIIRHLLSSENLMQDGGQWDMYAGILKKYGAVPKSCMPETFNSSASSQLGSVLRTLMREDACKLRHAFHEEKKSLDELQAMKEEMLYEVYQILCQTLGEPPTEVKFSYRDKDKKFHRIEGLTPQEFFEKYVGWNLDERISVIHAPTQDKPYFQAYTVKFLSSILEAKPVRYVNVPMEDLKKFAIRSIQAGHPVWFGCDVGQFLARKEGIMDLETYTYEDSLNIHFEMDKASRLDYGESLMTHAMVLVGVDLDENGKPLTWKVENSWGKESGDQGIYSMSDAWMDEFTYQIMVEREFVDEKALAAYDAEVKELEPWDPFGSLA